MKDAKAKVFAINGGTSSIRFALFEAGDSLFRVIEGGIERIGLSETKFVMKGSHKVDNLFTRSVTAANHTVTVGPLVD